jgi:hypothetical protein
VGAPSSSGAKNHNELGGVVRADDGGMCACVRPAGSGGDGPGMRPDRQQMECGRSRYLRLARRLVAAAKCACGSGSSGQDLAHE